MSVVAFMAHICDTSPAFECYASGDRGGSARFVARLSHNVGAPATSAALDQLKNWLGSHSIAFVDLYSKHNGAMLYQDSKGDAVGFWLYPIEAWESQTEEMRSQFEAMGFSPDEQPAATADSVAFAEIPHSANYFTVKVSGPDIGKIFYADHDDFHDEGGLKSQTQSRPRE